MALTPCLYGEQRKGGNGKKRKFSVESCLVDKIMSDVKDTGGEMLTLYHYN